MEAFLLNIKWKKEANFFNDIENKHRIFSKKKLSSSLSLFDVYFRNN